VRVVPRMRSFGRPAVDSRTQPDAPLVAVRAAGVRRSQRLSGGLSRGNRVAVGCEGHSRDLEAQCLALRAPRRSCRSRPPFRAQGEWAARVSAKSRRSWGAPPSPDRPRMWRHSFGVTGGAGARPSRRRFDDRGDRAHASSGRSIWASAGRTATDRTVAGRRGSCETHGGGTVFHRMDRLLTRDRGWSRAFQCVTGFDPLRSCSGRRRCNNHRRAGCRMTSV
jgi:hypothetical protein